MVFWQRKLILPIWLYFILSAGRLEICCVCIRCRKSKKDAAETRSSGQRSQEKNEVLNFLSESDALTGCMNRRGLMEKAVQMNRKMMEKRC